MYKNWNDLENACLSCQNCGLCQGRHHVVFGTGPREAQVMFVGEGPGENEDLQGEPFVGRGGQFLDKLLAAVDLDRHTNIYITNMVKCRPPQNRDPQPQEQEEILPLEAAVQQEKQAKAAAHDTGSVETAQCLGLPGCFLLWGQGVPPCQKPGAPLVAESRSPQEGSQRQGDGQGPFPDFHGASLIPPRL